MHKDAHAENDARVAATPGTHSPLRRDKRYSPAEVPWLRAARFKFGADVQVLDISANGIRVTHFDEIPIGAPVTLEFTTTTGALSVAARVVHCRDVETSGWVSYEIGCRFGRPLPWFVQETNGSPGCEMFDLLEPEVQGSNPTPSRREPMWVEHMIASWCELAAGVWLALNLVLVLSDWVARLLSK